MAAGQPLPRHHVSGELEMGKSGEYRNLTVLLSSFLLIAAERKTKNCANVADELGAEAGHQLDGRAG